MLDDMLWSAAGGGGGASFDDLWEWDPSDVGWTKRTPSPRPVSWPPPNEVKLAAFDPVHRGLFVAANALASNTATNALHAWLFAPTTGTWSEAGAVSPAPSAPANGCSIAGDSSRSRMVLLCNVFATPADTQTWEWDIATSAWSLRETATAGWRRGALVFDDRRAKIVWVGQAWDPVDAPIEVAEWDGSHWSHPALAPGSASPPPRRQFAAVYHHARSKIVLVGGEALFPRNQTLDDVWEYDPATSSWSERYPAPRTGDWLPARQAFAMAYDSKRELVVAFGGQRDATPMTVLDDLWAGLK